MSGAYNFCDTVYLIIQNHSLCLSVLMSGKLSALSCHTPNTGGGALCDIAIRPSVCLSASRWQRGAAAQAIGALAACSWPAIRDVRTADRSADGRRSAASRTVISGGAYRLTRQTDRQTQTRYTTTRGLELSAGRPPRTAGLRVLQTASENLALLQLLACRAH